MDNCRILSVGCAVPPDRYTQNEIIEYLELEKFKNFFTHPHIETRHLVLPPKTGGRPDEEDRAALLQKFLQFGISLSREAAATALREAGCEAQDIDALTCVSSTGFVVPALSAHLIEALGLKPSTYRLDIVGMGCNAGLNGLQAAATWCKASPGKKNLLICAEICSAIYSFDETVRTAVVNSLFGDGASATVLCAEAGDAPLILGFESHLIPQTLDHLRFDWDEQKHRDSFFIAKETPTALAAAIEAPVHRLLGRFGLSMPQIQHWILHTGGSAILDQLQARLNLKPEDLRHTRFILKNFGNTSSSSLFFTYREFLKEGACRKGDLAVLVTMGPGLTIETALVRW